MKVGRKKLRQIILEVLCEGEIIYPDFPDHQDDPDEKWDDLLDPDEYEELRSLRGQLRMLRGKEDQILRDIMSQTKEDDKKYPEDDEEFEKYLSGVESSRSGKSGQLIDLFGDYDDDALSEQKGEPDGTYGGPSGDPVPYGEDIYAEHIDEDDEIHEDSESDDSNQMASLRLKKQLDVAASNKYGGSTDDPSVAAAANAARSRQRSDTVAMQKLAGKNIVGE